MATVAATSQSTLPLHDNLIPKFNDYRSRIMLGDLPSDFLRIHLLESQIYDSQHGRLDVNHHPDFLGYFTLTIVEAKLIKNSGPLGLLRMDPYVRFQLSNVSYETPTANGGGKNPQWKVSYRLNLFKGMDRIHIEVFDQRSFTEDSFIGQSDIDIPRDVLEGQTHQQWYPLMGRDVNANENQGDILIVMSFTSLLMDNAAALENPSFSSSPTMSSLSSQSNSIAESSPSYLPEDITAIQEMFPAVDRQSIVDLMDKYAGNKDIVVNYLLQSSA